MSHNGPLEDVAGILARASLRAPETQRILVHRLLAERDRLQDLDQAFAGCLHAAAVLTKVGPGLPDATLARLQEIVREIVRFVDANAPRRESRDDSTAPELKSLNDARLGEVLVALGFVREEDIREAMDAPGAGRLGDTLVSLGKTTRKDVEAAANLHRTMSHGKKKGTDENGPTEPTA